VIEAKEESILDIPREKLTPGMQQYQDAKKENPDCLILMRMGDFYEIFYEDAITASKELEITLTARGKGEKRAPLAGVPYHALENYLARLVKKGYKVALVEQLEDPKKAKGLVKRGLVRIITPGTVIESSMLEESENNYLMAITVNNENFAIACCDLSTGEFFTKSLEGRQALTNELTRLKPSECVLPESLYVDEELRNQIVQSGSFINTIEDKHFKEAHAQEALQNHFKNPDSFGLEGKTQNIVVSGALLQYLTITQKNSLQHIKRISLRSGQHKMILDASTLRNLELLKNIKDGSKRGTLLSVLDMTVTSMGARLLKKWITEPLLQKERIEKRLHTIEDLNGSVIVREELRTLLQSVYDMERLISKVNYGNANPRDLISLKQSLLQIPLVKEKLKPFKSTLLQQISSMPDIHEVSALIETSITQDPPITIREGGIIKSGYNKELDELHDLKGNSKLYLQQLEQKEKIRTGIHTLKLSYNRVFGYYIEVTKKNTHLVPTHYIRKQTTANAERYITEELKIEEEKILGAQEKIQELEYNLFQDIIKKITGHTSTIQQAAARLSVLDVICSLARVSMEYNYVKPQIVGERVVQIKNGRHPVVERIESSYVSNDIFLQEGEMMIITGPNMAGKSTIMRQTALIVLMAQIGCFVPAEECVLGITDRIFTRVGAYDDLSSGQSTFMVEMNETASILNNATEHSLIILDEIGRGTSTFDGVSIAWSVAEHIYHQLKAKTMFATHYHVMNKLSEKFIRVKNYNIAVNEKAGDVIFLYKLVEGGTDQSYGVHVAKLAGLPGSVITRAEELQRSLLEDENMTRKMNAKKLEDQKGLGEF
jgi:DNA mismatch repair protein MutS